MSELQLTKCLGIDVRKGAQGETEAVVRTGKTHIAKDGWNYGGRLILCVHAATVLGQTLDKTHTFPSSCHCFYPTFLPFCLEPRIFASGKLYFFNAYKARAHRTGKH